MDGFIDQFKARHLPLSGIALFLFLTESPLPAQDAPIPRATPVEQASASETTPAQSQPATPAQPTAPRQKGPDEALYEYAALAFQQGDYKMALSKFEEYAKSYPKGIWHASSLLRIGECHLKLQDYVKAEEAYLALMKQYQKGENMASGAYRLGSLRFAQESYAAAQKYFELAATNGLDPRFVAQSNYWNGRSLEKINKPGEAIKAYESATKLEQDNDLLEPSLIALAKLQLDAGQKQQAMDTYLRLSQKASTPELLGESLVRAGLVMSELGMHDEALVTFEKVMAIPSGANEWKGIAGIQLLDTYYKKGDYQRIIQLYTGSRGSLPSQGQSPEVLLIVANAFNESNHPSQAIELYATIERYYKDSAQALEAGYQRVFALHKLRDPNVLEHVEGFLSRYGQLYKETENVSKVLLLKADLLYTQERYAEAAENFGKIVRDHIPENLRAGSLLKKGYSELKSDNSLAAIDTLTHFIDQYPSDPSLAHSLFLRSQAYRKGNDLDKALKDLTRVIQDFPESSIAEASLQESALIKGLKSDHAGMVQDFQLLIEKFPKSIGVPDAWYQIGSGNYKLQKYPEAVAALDKAIALNRAKYFEPAVLLKTQAWYHAQNEVELLKAVDEYLKDRPGATLNANMLAWGGFKFLEKNDHRNAARMLRMSANHTQPSETNPKVWLFLGQTELQVGEYVDSEKALLNFMAVTADPAQRANGLLSLSKAFLHQGKFADAHAALKEALENVKQGVVNARLTLALGDVFYAEALQAKAQGNPLDQSAQDPTILFQNAAANFVKVSLMWDKDAVITPEALYKAALAFEGMGDPARAENLQTDLKKRFPDYKPTPLPTPSASTNKPTSNAAPPQSPQPSSGTQEVGVRGR